MSSTESAFDLAFKHHQKGELAQAEALYRQILQTDSANVSACNNLGNVLKSQGRLAEAMACYRQAIGINPDYPNAHHNLGNLLQDQGQVAQAIDCYRQALRNSSNVEIYYNLGVCLAGQGRLAEAVVCYQKALSVSPNHMKAHHNLGLILLDEKLYGPNHSAAERKSFMAIGHFNLGVALALQGRLDEAVQRYRQALELNPNFAVAHTNLIYTLIFNPDIDPQTIHQEQQLWNRQHAEPLAKFIQPHANDKAPERRLRIGYVSPDFRIHPVGRFMLPLLEEHDRTLFEIYCYSSVKFPDTFTERCRVHADVWREVRDSTDEQVADLIRQDRIDILVDLTMHMADSRLLIFARKPAPVQATYLAYPGTTGLATMDYRLTDAYLDPPGRDERFYSEQSIRLPGIYCCYQPFAEAPALSPLPALQAGHVTFGCLNNFFKITIPTLEAWSHLLQKMPEARLLLHADADINCASARDYLVQKNIAPGRVTFVPKLPTAEYFRAYQRIDVALDPFPYGGGTTTMDALWMGVPVVSLVGENAVSRLGLTILSNVGLPELVAHDMDQYERVALQLAQDRPRLSELRASLRERMRNSPLMDAPRFARNMEAAYRSMWRKWCVQAEGAAPRRSSNGG